MRIAQVGLVLYVCAAVGACLTYSSGDDRPVACDNVADCNPGRQCGDMVQCVGGKCRPDDVVHLPCDQTCKSDADCAEGMHCRVGEDLQGSCVADGTCVDASECLGLPHYLCVGFFACEDGVCRYHCGDLISCAEDAQCALTDKGCCCGSTEEDYIALRVDKLAEWHQREECRGVYCPLVPCRLPQSIEAGCVDGRCTVRRIEDWFACESDGDCVVATEACCGCFDGLSDYVGVRQDKLGAWRGRQACADVQCEPCWLSRDEAERVCWQDECVEAFCRVEGGQGRCAARRVDPFACDVHEQCVRASLTCPSCDCHAGYPDAAIHRGYLPVYQDFLSVLCGVFGACAPGPLGVDACTDREAFCHQGRCEVRGQTCDCPATWEPVCVSDSDADGAYHTYPNRCQAECAWPREQAVYPGRCECWMMDCNCGDPDFCQACASNGQTYACSYGEIECNGLQPLYPGACEPRCDHCALLSRPPMPVCGAHFHTYADLCYAECLGRDYWHLGACSSGEGAVCGTSGGVPCPSEDLFCLIEDDVPGTQGRCIQLGSCLEASHCDGQPLIAPPCVGHWTCQNHACVFDCHG